MITQEGVIQKGLFVTRNGAMYSQLVHTSFGNTLQPLQQQQDCVIPKNLEQTIKLYFLEKHSSLKGGTLYEPSMSFS